MFEFLDAIYFDSYLYNGLDNIENGVTMFKKDKDSPMAIEPFCEVQLYDQNKREFIKSTVSDEEGRYSFKNLDLKKFKFFIISHHPKGTFNGVIADNIGGEDVDK